MGKYPNEELQAIWNEILFEYAGLINSDNSEYIFDITKKIALLSADITYIDGAVYILHITEDPELVEGLRNLGYPLVSGYQAKDLDRIISLAKTLVYEFEELQEELNKIQKIAGGKKQTESDFDSTVAVLSKFQGYAIRQKETTVSEFCGIFNLFLKQNKENGG